MVGIVVGPADALTPALDRGELVPLLPGYEMAARPTHLLSASDWCQTSRLRTSIAAGLTYIGDRASESWRRATGLKLQVVAADVRHGL